MRLNTTPLSQVKKGNKYMLGKLPAGNYKLHIEFGSTYSANGTGLYKYIDPSDNTVYFYSYMCPYYANKVFPCFDQPDLKASVSIIIESQDDYKAFSNESIALEEHFEPGFIRYIFNPTPPISTYILAIICGHFQGDDGIYSRSSLSPFILTHEIKQWLAEGLKEYHEFFGIEMPFSKCTQIFCPEFNMGAMENAGCVTINDSHVWKEKPVKSEYN